MALTKARTSLYSAQTLSASSADTTSDAVNNSGSYATLLNITLTNGGTGPTIPAQVRIQVSNDTSGILWTDLCTVVGQVTNNGIYYFSVEIPIAAQAFRTISGSNTGTAVTLNADYSLVTAL